MAVTRPAFRAARHDLLLNVAWMAAVAFGGVVAIGGLVVAPRMAGQDAHAYWSSGHAALTYLRPPRHLDAFLYSPLVADAIKPLTLLPWPVFWSLWSGAELAALLWLLRPLPPRWIIPIVLCSTLELLQGNVNVFLGVAVVVGMRHPIGWLFPILTKVVTGVGFLWFAVRGEWRRLAAAALIGTALVGLSYALQPGAWQGWVRLLLRDSGGSPDGRGWFVLRCLLGVAMVIVAARWRRPWVVPIAVALVTPVWTVMGLTILAAIPRLVAQPGTNRSFPGDGASSSDAPQLTRTAE
jgi:Glycosyltransferase family 87